MPDETVSVDEYNRAVRIGKALWECLMKLIEITGAEGKLKGNPWWSEMDSLIHTVLYKETKSV